MEGSPDFSRNLRSHKGAGTFNTVTSLAVESSKLFRVMTWNIEGLGGGFRERVRHEEIIEATAEVIRQVDPEICVIIEVMKYGRPRLPAKPQPLRKSVRHNNASSNSGSAFEDEESYKERLLEWEEKCRKLNVDKNDDSHPGESELKRILQKLGNGKWDLYLPGNTRYTHGETYAFFYKKELIKPIKCKFLDEVGKGFPNYRLPLLAHFQVKSNYFPVRSDTTKNSDWDLGIIAFHAPSPSHNKQPDYDVEKINENLGSIAKNYAENFELLLIAADTNLDTMGENRREEAIRIIESMALNPPPNWNDCPDLFRARTSLRASENLHSEQYDNLELIGMDIESGRNSNTEIKDNEEDLGLIGMDVEPNRDPNSEFIESDESDGSEDDDSYSFEEDPEEDPDEYYSRAPLPEDYTSAAFDKMIALRSRPNNIISQSLKVFPLLEAFLDDETREKLFPSDLNESVNQPFQFGEKLKQFEEEEQKFEAGLDEFIKTQRSRFHNLLELEDNPYAFTFEGCLSKYILKVDDLDSSIRSALIACNKISDHQPIFGDYEIKPSW